MRLFSAPEIFVPDTLWYEKPAPKMFDLGLRSTTLGDLVISSSATHFGALWQTQRHGTSCRRIYRH